MMSRTALLSTSTLLALTLTARAADLLPADLDLDQGADRTWGGAAGQMYGRHALAVGWGKTAILAVAAPEGDSVYLHHGLGTTKNMLGKKILDVPSRFLGQAGGEAGWSIATGRLVGDPAVDLVIGAPSENGGKGVVYVIDGNDLNRGDLFTADAAAALTGSSAAEYAGWSVAVGDFDDDGQDDLAVGAAGWKGFQGKVYVVPGPLGGVASLADHVEIRGEADPGDDIPPGIGATLLALDLDADGTDDLVAPTIYGGSDIEVTNGSGRVHVLYELPQVDSDLEDLDQRLTITSDRQVEGLGHTLAAGHLDKVGGTDLVLGASHYFCQWEEAGGGGGCFGFDDPGRAYVVLAQKRLLGQVDIEDLAVGWYEGVGSYFGMGLSVGDVNDDQQADVVVGDPSVGEAYVFHGGDVGELALGAPDPDRVLFSDKRGTGHAVVATTSFDADKLEDLVVIAPGQRVTYGDSNGAATMFYVQGR